MNRVLHRLVLHPVLYSWIMQKQTNVTPFSATATDSVSNAYLICLASVAIYSPTPTFSPIPCATLPPFPLSLHLCSSCPMKHVFNFFAVNKLNLEKESDEIVGKRERERRRRKRARRGAENELSTRTKHANEKFVCSFCRCPRKKKCLIVMRVTRTTLPIHRHIYTTISSIYIHYRYTICVQLCLRPL